MVNRLFPLYFNEDLNTVNAVLAERKECTFKADIATKKCLMKGPTWCFVRPAFPCEWDNVTLNVFKEIFGCVGNTKNYILGQMRFKTPPKLSPDRQGMVKSIKPTAPESGWDL